MLNKHVWSLPKGVSALQADGSVRSQGLFGQRMKFLICLQTQLNLRRVM